MEELELRFSDNILSMKGPKRLETLSIEKNYPWDGFSQNLFASLGTMHLVAPYLPKVITVNFNVPEPLAALINAMYRFEGRGKPPVLISTESSAKLAPTLPLFSKGSKKVAIAYSAGKDSMWNLWRAAKKYGIDNVLAVHVRNLNKNNGSDELKYTLRQQKIFGFKNLEIIELKNGSLNTGFQTMRSRDMFLMGLTIPVALKFGATQILTEGFYGAQADEPFFTGAEENMRYFNEVLTNLGIPIKVAWKNRNEMHVIKDLFENCPNWMPHLCNCFTIPVYKGTQRKLWQKRTPTFPLYDSQCGVCVKCKIVNLARILYDPEAKKISPKDILAFLRLTDNWVRDKRVKRSDMIEGAFMDDFKRACSLYGIKPKSA